MTWYAVQYKPSEGDRALANLEYQGAECFFPKIAVEKIRRGKRTSIMEPLFKGYLFVNVDTADPLWSKIRSTRGVSRLVAFAGKPASIDADIIQYIRASVDRLNEQGGISKGQLLKLHDGPFRGLEAVFQRYDGDERAVVLISFMQKQQLIKVPLASVASL